MNHHPTPTQRGIENSAHPEGPAEWQLNELGISTGGSSFPDHPSGQSKGILIQEATKHHRSWAQVWLTLRSCNKPVHKESQKV